MFARAQCVQMYDSNEQRRLSLSLQATAGLMKAREEGYLHLNTQITLHCFLHYPFENASQVKLSDFFDWSYDRLRQRLIRLRYLGVSFKDAVTGTYVKSHL